MASAERTELDLWPYQEARRLAERVGNYSPDREVILESGFGPSGLPHLGTMGEVLRPAYVQHAFKVLAASLAEGDKKFLPIFIVEEDCFAPVATAHQMINRSLVLNSQLARHRQLLT